LEVTRARYQLLSERSRDIMIFFRPDGRIVEANGAAVAAYGYSREELLALSFFDIRVPETHATLREQIEQVRHGSICLESEHLRRDGSRFPIEATWTFCRIGGDELILTVIRDISARRQVEEEKREALRLLDTLLRHAPVGFTCLDRELRYVRINERLAEINGLPVAAHLGRTVGEIVPTLEAAVREVTARILATGEPVLDHEFTGETAREPGVTRHWMESWYPVRGEGGEIVGFGGVVEEITARREHDERLRLAAERNAIAQEAARAFFYEYDPATDGVIRGSAFTAVMGFGCDEIPAAGAAWQGLIHPEDHAAAWTEIGRAIAEAEGFSLEYRVRHRAGHYLWIHDRAKILREPAGSVRVVGMVIDVSGQKQVEDRLRASDARLRLALDASHAGLWEWDAETGRCRWDETNCAHYAFAPDEPRTFATWLARLHPEERPRVLARLEVMQATPGEDDWVMDFRAVLPDGTVRWMHGSGRATRDGEGRIRHISGLNFDITARKAAEDRLREREHFLQRIMEVTPGVLHVFDMQERRPVFVNRSVAALLGYPPEEILSMGSEALPRLMHPEDIARLDAHLRQIAAMSDGEVATFDHRMRHRGGDWRWFSSRDAVFTRDGAGRPRELLGAAIEVTPQKLAEMELRASEGRMRLATEATGVGIWEWNVVTDVIRWDAQMFRLYGVPPTADGLVPYETWSRAVLPEDLPRQEEVLRDTLRRRGQSSREFRIVRGDDGECRTLQAVETVRTNADGDAQWVVGTNLDVTEQRRAEEAIREEARRKDEFLAMLGHELRNPLNAIRHAVQLAADAPDERAWAAGVIDRQSAQLARMVDDLLDVARINRGLIELRPEAVELGAVLESAIAVVRPLLAQRRHTFTREIGVGLRVTGDATRLEQVFVNLLNNAAKYTPEGGTIALTARQEDGQVVVRIADDGVGIAAELLPHVFDLFRQAESTLDRAPGGLGIGLNVVKSLVEMHLGRVTVESPGPGAGATFTVRLPLLLLEPAAPARRSAADAPERGARVLVVDDHLDAARTLARLLARRGCEVREAHTGPEAVAVAREFLPQTVLLDLGLPGFDGYEVARQLRADGTFASTHLIAISGYAQQSDRERCLAGGFDAHFAKPLDFARIMDAIQAARRTGRETADCANCAD
jgi:PAS domain S-box-containing protein